MKFEFSAGGIVIKKELRKNFILLGKHSQHHGWIFPKGLIADHIKNENKEETAIREVEEETGVKAAIIQILKPVVYWYVHDGEKIKKTVYYFLMRYVSGDIKTHDFEMEEVAWVEENDVEKKLTFPSDKQIYKETRQLINEHR